MKNKKKVLKVVFVFVIGFSLGSVSTIILKAKFGPANVKVEEYITYQEIDYTLKRDNVSMTEFELSQAKEFFYNHKSIFPKQTRIRSLNLDIYEGSSRYFIMDYNAGEETEYNSLEDLFDYLEARSKPGDKYEGIKEGEKNKAVEIAKSLLDILDIETIALKTGLSVDEINELKIDW